jgi:PTS system fructose-specific IIC component/fructose-specific PTS system IIC-like component
MLELGVTSFTLMLPVLAGYIAYSIAGKPALVCGT